MKLLIPSMPEYGYHESINRKTMEQHMKQSRREWRLTLFKRQPTYNTTPSFWLATLSSVAFFPPIYA